MSVLAWRIRLRHTVRTLVSLSALGSAAALLGCGGGGGGGSVITKGVCGLPEGSTTPAICGTVTDANAGTAVSGATVTLEDAAGNPISGTSTLTTGTDGTFVFAGLPSSAAGVKIVAPTGFIPTYILFKAELWDDSKGPITTVWTTRPTAPTDVGIFGTYSTNSPPPAPPTRP